MDSSGEKGNAEERLLEPLSTHESIERSGGGAVIYDSSIIESVSEKTFSASAWRHVKPVDNVLQSGGRGYTLIISDGKREYVLRHYRRGGFIGRFVRDSYVWVWSIRRTSSPCACPVFGRCR